MPAYSRVLILCLAAGIFSQLAVRPALGAPPSDSATPGGASPPALKDQFFIVSEQDRQTIVTLVVAEEFNKLLQQEAKKGQFRPEDAPWVIPEASWGSKELAAQCSEKGTIGGVVLTYYSGFASHFWLLWQTQTTTFYVFAQLVACNRETSATVPPGPVVVGIISELPGNEPWIERRTQTSVPLLTLAAVGTVLSKSSSGSNSKTSNLTITAIAGSLFSSSGAKDIPGYSDPLRLRTSSQHIGDDLIASLDQLCDPALNDVAANNLPPRTLLCNKLHFPRQDKTLPTAWSAIQSGAR